MNKPDWFVLIEQWRKKGMGLVGITLPFLVGALAYSARRAPVGAKEVSDVLERIKNEPVLGYVTEIKWCENIGSPVLAVELSKKSVISAIDTFKNHEGKKSVVFGLSLKQSFQLGCKNSHDCFAKLLDDATKHVERGNFSKYLNLNSGLYEYGPFSEDDIAFIKDCMCSRATSESARITRR